MRIKSNYYLHLLLVTYVSICIAFCFVRARLTNNKYCLMIVSALLLLHLCSKGRRGFFLKASCIILLAIIPHYALRISFLWHNPIMIVMDQYIRKFPYKEQPEGCLHWHYLQPQLSVGGILSHTHCNVKMGIIDVATKSKTKTLLSTFIAFY